MIGWLGKRWNLKFSSAPSLKKDFSIVEFSTWSRPAFLIVHLVWSVLRTFIQPIHIAALLGYQGVQFDTQPVYLGSVCSEEKYSLPCQIVSRRGICSRSFVPAHALSICTVKLLKSRDVRGQLSDNSAGGRISVDRKEQVQIIHGTNAQRFAECQSVKDALEHVRRIDGSATLCLSFQMSESVSLSSTSTESTKSGDCLKIIVLGDSAVGKSKLLERFLINS